jgi:uncharacterized protein (TIGR02444 family)
MGIAVTRFKRDTACAVRRESVCMDGGIMGTEEFWEFALARYARPGVAQCCVALQDEHGANVMLLLYCAWRAQGGDCVRARRCARRSRASNRSTVTWCVRCARRGAQFVAPPMRSAPPRLPSAPIA